MAIVINDKPGNYYSAHDDLLFVVYEATKANDPTTYPDYRYVADIYVDGVLVTRQKKDPNPTSKRGIFNIGSAVRAYLSTAFNPTGSSFVAQQIGKGEFYVKVTVKFGEEYDGTLYTNRTIDEDRYHFNHYNGRLLGTRTALSAKLGLGITNRPYQNYVRLSSGRSFIPFFPNTASTAIEIKTYNHDNTLVTTKNTSYAPTSNRATRAITYTINQNNSIDVDLEIYVNGVLTISKFITATGTFNVTEGDTINVKMLTDGTVAWPVGGTPHAHLNVTDGVTSIYNQYTTSQGAATYHVIFETTFTAQDRPYVITVTGDNTAVPTSTLVNDSSTNFIAPYKMQVFDVCPATINGLYAGLITDYIKYYTVKIGATSIYRFDIQCEPRFTNNTLHFLNQYGGFESFDFNKVSRKNINIEKKDFGKLGYAVSSLGIVSYNNSNNVYNEQKAVYSSQFTESLTLNSDILSDGEYTWLGELMISPLVFLEQEGYFIPVVITSNNYDYKKQINDKLTNLAVTLDFGSQLNGQYR